MCKINLDNLYSNNKKKIKNPQVDGRVYYSRGTSKRIVKIQIMSEILKMISRWKKPMSICMVK